MMTIIKWWKVSIGGRYFNCRFRGLCSCSRGENSSVGRHTWCLYGDDVWGLSTVVYQSPVPWKQLGSSTDWGRERDIALYLLLSKTRWSCRHWYCGSERPIAALLRFSKLSPTLSLAKVMLFQSQSPKNSVGFFGVYTTYNTSAVHVIIYNSLTWYNHILPETNKERKTAGI